ncbi:MAG TPA: NAD(P)H-dependent oxidoreductase [Planctomycetota bacterium]|nr:NAD(P)H-dependent oxidoreductase [Planctomycetota bacterium]
MSQASAPSLPAALAPEALLERLHWRYAVKKFDPSRKIPADTWAALEEVLRLSPSSYGLQPWRFVVVQDKGLRETLRAASWNQAQITEASHMVVFAARRGIGVSDVERFVDSMVEQRGVTREALAGYARTMTGFVSAPPAHIHLDTWASRQTYIALGFFLEACALLGVDACPMEGLEPAKYDEILGLKQEGFGALCVATAGYRSAEDKYATEKKVRFPVGEVVQHR